MNPSEISKHRLYAQNVGNVQQTVQEIVHWMGAVQAQDYKMAKWAIGSRLEKAKHEWIDEALNSGEIIRTHILRPTWHLVSAKDIWWMLELSGPHIKSTYRASFQKSGFTGDALKKLYQVIEKVLRDENHLTRDELVLELNRVGVETNRSWAYHLFMYAELDRFLCNGRLKEGKQTYALLEEWVPQKQVYIEDEALFKLAERYFQSHSPATLKDFIWWSGLPVKKAKKALEMLKPSLNSIELDKEVFWMKGEFQLPNKTLFTLPAFDEFIIAYKNKDFSIPFEKYYKKVHLLGTFWPIIVQEGAVIGTWKRKIKKDKVIISTQLFKRINQSTKKLIKDELSDFAQFIGKELELLVES